MLALTARAVDPLAVQGDTLLPLSLPLPLPPAVVEWFAASRRAPDDEPQTPASRDP